MNESVKIETFIFNVRYILQYFNSNEDYAQERDKYLIFKSEKKKYVHIMHRNFVHYNKHKAIYLCRILLHSCLFEIRLY